MYSFGFLTTTAPVTSQVTQPIPGTWVRVRAVFSASSVLADKRLRWGNAQLFLRGEELKPSTVPRHTFLLLYFPMCPCASMVGVPCYRASITCSVTALLFLTCLLHVCHLREGLHFPQDSSDKHNIVLKQKEKNATQIHLGCFLVVFVVLVFVVL